jgi:uncharacterized protein (DUF2336 family)
MTVRQTISAQLATFKETPPELAAMLANDEIEVAYPILTQSEVLQDAQLIETIRNRTLEHQMAIAIRHTVPVVVSDALVETGDEDIIRTLLENSGAGFRKPPWSILSKNPLGSTPSRNRSCGATI